MPAFLEKKLKSEYGSKSAIPYKIMNKMGVMNGNKETAKGKTMEKKHHGPLSEEGKAKRKRGMLSRAADKMLHSQRST